MTSTPSSTRPRTSRPASRFTARDAAILVLALVLPLVAVLGLPVVPTLDPAAATVLGLVALWLFAAVVALLSARAGGRSRIGLRPTPVRWWLLAVAIGVGLMLLVPALSLLAGLVLPSDGAGIADAVERPWPLVLAGVLTAAVTEEVLFRAAPIETLAATGASPWLGFALGLVAFTVLHAGSWNPAHVVGVVLPLGALLGLLYLWRRNLVVVVIAHLVTDLPLVVLAAL